MQSKIKWIGKVAIYHGQTGFEIVPIEENLDEAHLITNMTEVQIKKEVNEVISKIAKGVNDDS